MSSNAENTCPCTRSDGVVISNRHVSGIIAGGIACMPVAFSAGYFLGKHYLVEQFVAKAEQDSFADQVYTSL